jgi:hypothetical protein
MASVRRMDTVELSDLERRDQFPNTETKIFQSGIDINQRGERDLDSVFVEAPNLLNETKAVFSRLYRTYRDLENKA